MRSPSWPVLVAVVSIVACDPPQAQRPASSPSEGAVSDGTRMPVFADRMKQVPFERGRARLNSVRTALLSPTLSSAQTTELGFECATLKGERITLAGEEDPLVRRFVADAARTCGLDVPLAAAYVELRAIDAARESRGSLKSGCFGLKVAVRDFGPEYAQNPMATEVAKKLAERCTPQAGDGELP